MEVAELRTLIAVRDSKDPDGPKLLFPVAEWRSFTDAVQVGRFELGLAGSVEEAELHDQSLDGSFTLVRIAVPDGLAEFGADVNSAR